MGIGCNEALSKVHQNSTLVVSYSGIDPQESANHSDTNYLDFHCYASWKGAEKSKGKRKKGVKNKKERQFYQVVISGAIQMSRVRVWLWWRIFNYHLSVSQIIFAKARRFANGTYPQKTLSTSNQQVIVTHFGTSNDFLVLQKNTQ